MTVLLGGIGAAKKKYEMTKSFPVKSYVWIHQFIHKTNSENNKFYVIYYLYRDGRFLKGLSPIFKGTYENGKFIKPITAWIESIGQDPNAQYTTMFSSTYKKGNFSRGYKAF